jgi:hypothetical protein
MGPIYVSLDSPFTRQPDGSFQIDRLGTSNVAPLVTGGQINPALAANNIQVIKETHGKTSQLSASDLEALELYLKSLDGAKPQSTPNPTPTPTVTPTPAPTPTPSATPTPTPTPTPGPTPSPSPTPTPGNEARTVRFSAASYSVNEGTGSINITVLRGGNLSQESKVKFQTTDGTALDRSDYTRATGRLVFAPGEASKSFSVLITDDAFVEGDEIVNLSLFDASNSTQIISPGAVVLTIRDNDSQTAAANPFDEAQFFVRQQYHDFLNREPDAGGLNYWSKAITDCRDASCVKAQRINVSAAFFAEGEFQQTGYFIYRLYRGALGRRPGYAEFMQDRSGLIDVADVNAATQAFTDEWATRAEFLQEYPADMMPELFVVKLMDVAGLAPYTEERQQLASALRRGEKTRAQVLREVVNIAEFQNREYNAAFVLMQYFGYLRRNPDEGGYQFWLDVLNNGVPNNYKAMVCAFITSAELQDRFAGVQTHNNSECGP